MKTYKRMALISGMTLVWLAGLSRGAFAQGGTWATKAPMPTPRWGLRAGAVNGTVYAVGGAAVPSTCSYLATNEAYDPTTNTWTTKASMPTGRESLGVGVVNGILYAVGGGVGCGSYSAALEAFDPLTDTWTTKAPMPTVRWGPGVGVVNGILYVVGGVDNSGLSAASLLAYDPGANTWTTKAPMPTPRVVPGVGVVNGILYAVGGSAASGTVDTVEAYDPTTDTWTTKASMPTLRAYGTVGVVNDIIYAVGGASVLNGVNMVAVDAYDPATDSWTTAAPMPTGRTDLATAEVNGTLYVVGGENSSNTIFATNEAFTPDDNDSGLAKLNGGNTFTGNQTVNGTVSATSFMGNGAGLTGVNAQTAVTAYGLTCTACVGNMQLGISYALGDSQGGNAVNALSLGGFPASAFAPTSGSPSYAPAAGSTAYVAKAGDTMTGALSLPALGIGTASPNTNLELASGYNGGLVGQMHLESTGTEAGITLEKVAGGTQRFSVKVGNNSTGDGNFGIDDLTAPGVPRRLSITPAGNVGIGTQSPQALLEVNGTAQFGGTVTFASGQAFPGTGTITGVTAGTGLSGGGSSGAITLNNTGLLSLTTGTGIMSTGGQTPTISLSTTFTDGRYLQLSGGTLTGGVTAPSFTGSGSGLTALNPANLNAGTAGINITGNAATATSAGAAATATNAANSANLGGVAATNYARLDIANNFAGNQSVSGNVSVSGNSTTTGTVTIGSGGTAITKHLSVAFSASFAALKPSTCTVLTFAFPGASDGDTIALGVPNSMMTVAGVPNYFAWVSAANIITIRACNLDPSVNQKVGTSGTIRLDVWKH